MIVCPDCKQNISDIAPACPGCGRPPISTDRNSLVDDYPRRARARRKSRWVLAFLLIIFPVSVVCWALLGSGSLTSTTDLAIKELSDRTNADGLIERTTIQKIMADYMANEVSADDYYRGRIVQVDGTVERIKKDISDTPYVILNGAGRSSYRSFQAFFSQSSTSQLGNLRKGQVITVRCRIDGLSVNVLARACSIQQ